MLWLYFSVQLILVLNDDAIVCIRTRYVSPVQCFERGIFTTPVPPFSSFLWSLRPQFLAFNNVLGSV